MDTLNHDDIILTLKNLERTLNILFALAMVCLVLNIVLKTPITSVLDNVTTLLMLMCFAYIRGVRYAIALFNLDTPR